MIKGYYNYYFVWRVFAVSYFMYDPSQNNTKSWHGIEGGKKKKVRDAPKRIGLENIKVATRVKFLPNKLKDLSLVY